MKCSRIALKRRAFYCQLQEKSDEFLELNFLEALKLLTFINPAPTCVQIENLSFLIVFMIDIAS